jgi:undecaprenyl-diphosphatase
MQASEVPAHPERPNMTVLQGLILGIAEGLTEFIPVSSTAHMLILQHLMGVESGESVFAFLVLVQLGPLAALLLYFWKDFWSLVLAFFVRPFSTPRNRQAWYVVIATVPALLAGVLLKDVVTVLFQNPLVEAAIRLFTAAALLLLAEMLGRRTRTLDGMKWHDALVIGLFQVLAVFPGASRSGSTISAGMYRQLDRPSATRFAFLLAAPVMLAAGAYETLGVVRAGASSVLAAPLLVGFVIAGMIGWLSIRWLLHYVGAHSLYLFSAYCFVAGLASLTLLLV